MYPETRTSDAIAIRAAYYLPYRAALKGEYRYFTDDWGIIAHTYELKYTHPFNDAWLVDLKFRTYEQQQADFYSDLFTFASQDSKDFRARDKELSTFENQTIGLSISYQLPHFSHRVEQSRISLEWDYINFSYDNFTDLGDITAAVGEERQYEFSANVIKFFFSIWY